MSCGVIKQCSALTKHKCQCKNHVTNNGEFCDRHSKTANVVKKEEIVVKIEVNVVKKEELAIKPGFSIPENIFVNGKFIPNVNKIQVPIPVLRPNGKTPDQMYKYLFPHD